MKHQPFGHIAVLPPERKGLISWWQDAERENFTKRSEQEVPRMKTSKAYQQIGNSQVVGQLDRDRHVGRP